MVIDETAKEIIRQTYCQVMPQDDEALWWWIKANLGFAVPRVPICQNHSSPFQIIADNFFDRHAFQLGVAARKGGKTLDSAIIMLLNSYFKERCGTINMAGSEEQVSQGYTYAQRMFTESETFQPFVIHSLAKETLLKNGAWFKMLPSSEKSAQSKHCPRLIGDELESTKWSIFQKSLSIPQTMNGIPANRLILSSRYEPYGNIQVLMTEAERRGIRQYTWCVLDVMEKCEHECKGCLIEEYCQGKARNAAGFLKYQDVIDDYRSLDREMARCALFCLEPGKENLVYPMFGDRNIADFDWVPPSKLSGELPVVAGIDWGFSEVHPFVCTLSQIREGKVWTFLEVYLWGKSLARILSEDLLPLKAKYNVGLWWADPSSPGSIEGAREVLGDVRGAPKKGLEQGFVTDGINLLRKHMDPPGADSPAYMVSTKCPNLIREYHMYHRKEGSNDPVKDNDHGPDAERYKMMGLFHGKTGVKSGGYVTR